MSYDRSTNQTSRNNLFYHGHDEELVGVDVLEHLGEGGEHVLAPLPRRDGHVAVSPLVLLCAPQV